MSQNSTVCVHMLTLCTGVRARTHTAASIVWALYLFIAPLWLYWRQSFFFLATSFYFFFPCSSFFKCQDAKESFTQAIRFLKPFLVLQMTWPFHLPILLISESQMERFIYFKSVKGLIIPIFRSFIILWSPVDQACTIRKLNPLFTKHHF